MGRVGRGGNFGQAVFIPIHDNNISSDPAIQTAMDSYAKQFKDLIKNNVPIYNSWINKFKADNKNNESLYDTFISP